MGLGRLLELGQRTLDRGLGGTEPEAYILVVTLAVLAWHALGRLAEAAQTGNTREQTVPSCCTMRDSTASKG